MFTCTKSSFMWKECDLQHCVTLLLDSFFIYLQFVSELTTKRQISQSTRVLSQTWMQHVSWILFNLLHSGKLSLALFLKKKEPPFTRKDPAEQLGSFNNIRHVQKQKMRCFKKASLWNSSFSAT